QGGDHRARGLTGFNDGQGGRRSNAQGGRPMDSLVTNFDNDCNPKSSGNSVDTVASAERMKARFGEIDARLERLGLSAREERARIRELLSSLINFKNGTPV